MLPNPVTAKYEIILPVRMWDRAYETAVQQALSSRTGRPISLTNIQPLPMESVRIDYSDRQIKASYSSLKTFFFDEKDLEQKNIVAGMVTLEYVSSCIAL